MEFFKWLALDPVTEIAGPVLTGLEVFSIKSCCWSVAHGFEWNPKMSSQLNRQSMPKYHWNINIIISIPAIDRTSGDWGCSSSLVSGLKISVTTSYK